MFVDSPLSDVEVDICYLDNTYFNKRYDVIPTREQAAKEIIAIISCKRDQVDNVIFHLNLKTLGKEDLLVELFNHFKIPILISEARYNRCVNIIGLREECFTTVYCEETLIFVNDINCVPDFGEHKTIVYIEPTALSAPFRTRRHKSIGQICDNLTNSDEKHFPVAYTDHSSYGELVEFAKRLRPKQFVPIVRKSNPGDINTSNQAVNIHFFNNIFE
jgi:DNA cross-link repair 1B protein